MCFWYQVILRPCDVKFTCKEISTKFKNGRLLQALLDDLLNGRKLVKDAPVLEVVWYLEKWEWYTLDNRLLWVFQELEKAGKISYIAMRRIEFITKITDYPKELFGSAKVVDADCEESFIDRPSPVKGGKKCKDVKLLSKSLSRLHLCKSKSDEKARYSQLENEKDTKGESSQSTKNGDCKSDTPCCKSDINEITLQMERLNHENNFSLDSGKITECNNNSITNSDSFHGHLEPNAKTGCVTQSPMKEDGIFDAPCAEENELKANEIAPEMQGLVHENNVALNPERAIEGKDNAITGCDSSNEHLGPKNEAGCATLVDVEDGLDPSEFKSSPETIDITKKEETDDIVENEQTGDVLSICHSRSPSVCLSLDDDRSIDDWGRKERKRSLNLEENGQLSDDDWIDIECCDDFDEEPVFESNKQGTDENGNICDSLRDLTDYKAKEAVEEWLNDRKKFCRNSKDSHFHEYVVDHIDPKKPKQSLSQSLLSLDSAFSSAFSVISREQRQISLMSGLSGYGNFDKYNTEYLSKLRSERLASKRRLKPYDVGNSRHAGARPRRQSLDGDENNSRDSGAVFWKAERVQRRSYSETVDVSYRKTYRYRSFSSTTSSSMSCYSSDSKLHRRERSRSETDSLHQHSTRRSFSSIRSGRRKMSSRSFSGSSLDSFNENRNASFSVSLRNRSLSKEQLYSSWKMRREDYMKARYRNSSSRHKSSSSLAMTGYTCGLCFKSFKTRTRREQHSDELMHWACITCGRFFASHTALGQHVDEVGHRKD